MRQTPQSYHQATSYDRYAMEPHAMDWASQPDPYKSYTGLYGVKLPEIQDLFDKDLYDQSLQTVYDTGRLKKTENAPSLETLSTVCMLAVGLTARSRQGGGYFYYRSAPSAGALYPNEMYFAAFDSQALPAGIYHCGGHNRVLTRLRDGNFATQMQAIVPGLAPDSAGVFIVSGIFFRSAWKYRKRAYRYVLLDAGHLVENLRLAISAAGYACRLHHAVDDRKSDELLGLDEHREGSVCCVSIAGGKAESFTHEAKLEKLPEKIQAASCVSSAEVVYSEITEIHEASKTIMESDSAEEAMISGLGICPPAGYSLFTDLQKHTAILNYSEAVFQRRSKRNFIPKSIENNQLSYILTLLCRASGQIDENPEIPSSVCIGFLAGNVNGVEPGFYLLDPVAPKIGRVFSGNAIETMTSVCLDQAWLKHAAVHFVFMSNLEILEKKWGARGYRYAMMTAGRLGHAVYLGAASLGLGCCGIGALYDNEARQLLGLNDQSALLYLVAAGNTK